VIAYPVGLCHRRGLRAGLLILVLLALAGCSGKGTSTPAAAPTATRAIEAPAPPAASLAPTHTAPQLLTPTANAATPSRAPITAAAASPTAAPTRQPASQPTGQPSNPPAVPDLAALRLTLKPLARGLDRPVFVTGAPGDVGRLFIVEKPGAIRIWDGNQLLATPFLDIRDRVLSRGQEQGLLGLAFAPDYATSGFFYVYYVDLSANVQISRFKVTGDPALADPASELKVLNVKHPAANHNGGMLAFGPDGRLYAGLGDGGGAGDVYRNGQNPDTLLAKIIRLDVTSDPSVPYRVPADNPWVIRPWNGRPMLPEAWQMGLRNPWRFSFDRLTGDLWIGDVGQDAYEEVDTVQAGSNHVPGGGLNFGWSIMEGTHCYPETVQCDRTGLTLPILDYPHAGGDCSITGGYVYRGREHPALTGVYLYGDWCSGKIWGLAPDGRGGWQHRQLLATQLSLSSFGEDSAGELYAVDLNGTVYGIGGG